MKQFPLFQKLFCKIDLSGSRNSQHFSNSTDSNDSNKIDDVQKMNASEANPKPVKKEKYSMGSEITASAFTLKKVLWMLLAALILALIFTAPYWLTDGLEMRHDTMFHLSRIEGYATSLQNGVLFPRIYPYKNANFGYASPLFYCDLLLFLPACLTLMGVPLVVSYKVTVFVILFIATFLMMICAERIFHHQGISFLCGTAFIFSNYLITDIYVRGALGETMAFMFFPLVLMGIQDFFYLKNRHLRYIILGFSGLILTHNISFILACILFFCFIVLNLRQWKEVAIPLLVSILLVTGCTAFFTFPMLEQLSVQQLYLHLSRTDLASTTLTPLLIFANETVMGYGANNLELSQTMLMNAGYFIQFGSLSFFANVNTKSRFLGHCFGVGFLFFLASTALFPWKYFHSLDVIQFAFRLTTVVVVLGCLVAGAGFVLLFQNARKQRLAVSFLMFLLTAEGLYHLQPCFKQTTFKNDTPYQAMIDGSIFDPYYADSFFVRAELAGADYLPVASVDYRTESRCATALGKDVSCFLDRDYLSMKFSISSMAEVIDLPLTYYKGYQVYAYQDDREIALETRFDQDKHLVQFVNPNGTYSHFICRYEATKIQQVSGWISVLAVILVMVMMIQRNHLPIGLKL